MNILNKVEDYLKFQSEVFGDDINTITISPTPVADVVPVSETNSVADAPAKEITPVATEAAPLEKDTSEISDNTNKQGQSMEGNQPAITSSEEPTQPKESTLTVHPEWAESDSLEILNSRISGCLECELGKDRNKLVFGAGNPNADIMVIGEAPGADEDEQGLPFVGRAGKLLTKMLEAIYIKREDIYIANICKCRPPGNRRPTGQEVDACEPYLKKQIELIKPAFILSLGLTSVDTLLKKKHRMGDIRGNIMDYHGIDMLVTYHPAALLRNNPEWKKLAWEDLKKLRMLYDKYLLTKNNK